METKTQEKLIRKSLSFKQNARYLLDAIDCLCQGHKLNQSDLPKLVIKKEQQNLRSPDNDIF